MITNGYCTLAQIRSHLGYQPAETADDTQLELCVNAASRQIDGYCGRRFWQDGTAVAREYFPDSATEVCTDDISTLTGLVVKVDIDLDGVFESTLTINTDFQPHPRNALLEVPACPYTELKIVPVGSQAFFPRAMYGRASVQVTAKFGWPAIPDDVTMACLIQSAALFKSQDAVFGAVALGDTGGVMFSPGRVIATARALLDGGPPGTPYRKAAVG